jgi:hypothetical protein
MTMTGVGKLASTGSSRIGFTVASEKRRKKMCSRFGAEDERRKEWTVLCRVQMDWVAEREFEEIYKEFKSFCHHTWFDVTG